MNGYDGPTLRSLRESQGVTLRRVARQAGLSHGHLSKVERGELGRPVTPAVLAAYEAATGIRLTGVAGHGPGEPGGWRRGHLNEARRRTLNAKIAAVAVGGTLGEQLTRIMEATGRLRVPEQIEEADATQVRRAGEVCTGVDLQFGGGVSAYLARAVLRWAIGLLECEGSDQVVADLHAAVAELAQRAGWAAFDADAHDMARSLLTVALYAATRADDPDLRAHVIADFATQHNYLGYPDDCLALVRFGEVDERVGPAVRMVLCGVKARAFAMRGEERECRQHLDLAEQAHTEAATAGGAGWLATVATPAHLYATTGHAAATLARRTGSASARAEAHQRLAAAIDHLDPAGQARTAVLCQAQLATLLLEAGDRSEGADQATRVLEAATGIRSHRLAEHLSMLRTAAAADPATGAIVTAIDARLAT